MYVLLILNNVVLCLLCKLTCTHTSMDMFLYFETESIAISLELRAEGVKADAHGLEQLTAFGA